MRRALCTTCGVLWTVALIDCGSNEPRITPVAPLTLDSVQPMSREPKQQFVERHGTDFQLVARLLQLSLDCEHRVIRVVHGRERDSPDFVQLEAEAVRPAPDFVGKYSGVRFLPVAMTRERPPFDQDTLLIRYKMVETPYHADRGPVTLNEVLVLLTLLGAKQEAVPPPHDEISVRRLHNAAMEIAPYGSSLDRFKQELAERLGLTVMTERNFPIDPEREARERAKKVRHKMQEIS